MTKITLINLMTTIYFTSNHQKRQLVGFQEGSVLYLCNKLPQSRFQNFILEQNQKYLCLDTKTQLMRLQNIYQKLLQTISL